MQTSTYHARRYRSLFAPDALDFKTPRPRISYTPHYSPVANVMCGLPRSAKARGSVALPFIVPAVVATGITTYFAMHKPE